MKLQLFPDYILILLLIIPTLIYALIPLRDYLRFSIKRTAAIALASCFVIIAVCAIVGTAASMSFKYCLIISLIPTLAVHMWLSTGKMPMRFFAFFNAAMICGYALLYGCVAAAPVEKDGSYTTMSPLTSLICLAVMLALGIVYYKTLRTNIPYLLTSEPLNLDYRLGLAITIAIAALFFWVTPKCATVVMTGRVRSTILAFLLLGPGAYLLIYHAMWRVAVNLTENSRLRESNELMAMEQKRYEELRTYMDETRNLRHDFRQHLLVIDDYAGKGETDKLRDYIGQFTESLSEHRSEFAANPAVDAVAAHYDSLAASQNTHFKWLIELPKELPVKESDFITVFGNLVENALIAMRELPEDKRSVHVNAKMLSDAMLGLTVRNPYDGSIKINKKGLPSSDKPDHGIGLSSVNAVVNRYNGALDISTDGGIFTAGVLFYLQDSSVS